MLPKEFITEYDRSATEQRFKSQILNRIDFDGSRIGMSLRDLDPEEKIQRVMDILEKSNTTGESYYTVWLAKSYSQGQTDLDEIQDELSNALKEFHLLKRRNKLGDSNPDITTYSVDELMNMISEKDDEPKNKPEFTVALDTPEVKIIIPENEAASKKYGANTKWCTAARVANQFENYNNRGRLYIIIPKNPSYPQEKYQAFISDSGNFVLRMANDHTINSRAMINLIKRTGINKFFEPLLAEKNIDHIMGTDPENLNKKIRNFKSNLENYAAKIDTNNYMIYYNSASPEFKKEIEFFCNHPITIREKYLEQEWYGFNIKDSSPINVSYIRTTSPFGKREKNECSLHIFHSKKEFLEYWKNEGLLNPKVIPFISELESNVIQYAKKFRVEPILPDVKQHKQKYKIEVIPAIVKYINDSLENLSDGDTKKSSDDSNKKLDEHLADFRILSGIMRVN